MFARARMTELDVRHLPVVDGGRLLGILSDRDIKFIESFPDVDARELTVGAAMNEAPYAVGPDATIDEVAATMALEKHGSAVVVHEGQVVGIFTTVDACRALSKLLRGG
jgi:acetoin utilization protein AcuB